MRPSTASPKAYFSPSRPQPALRFWFRNAGPRTARDGGSKTARLRPSRAPPKGGNTDVTVLTSHASYKNPPKTEREMRRRGYLDAEKKKNKNFPRQSPKPQEQQKERNEELCKCSWTLGTNRVVLCTHGKATKRGAENTHTCFPTSCVIHRE